MKNNKTIIKTTWGRVFKGENLCLINAFPTILNDLQRYEELDRWYAEEDEDSCCEVFQWYIVDSTETVDWLKNYCPEIASDIHWSETLGNYVLAVYHLGTSWDYVPVDLEVEDEQLAKFYQKSYHDDLPEDVLKMVFGEN